MPKEMAMRPDYKKVKKEDVLNSCMGITADDIVIHDLKIDFAMGSQVTILTTSRRLTTRARAAIAATSWRLALPSVAEPAGERKAVRVRLERGQDDAHERDEHHVRQRAHRAQASASPLVMKLCHRHRAWRASGIALIK